MQDTLPAMDGTINTSEPHMTLNDWRADPLMEQAIVEESMTDDELAIALECDAQDQLEYSPKPTMPLPVDPITWQGTTTQGEIKCQIGARTN